MTPSQMRKFILLQNSYTDDYDRSIWHSKEALADFCFLEKSHPKYSVFEQVYDKLTKEKEAAE